MSRKAQISEKGTKKVKTTATELVDSSRLMRDVVSAVAIVQDENGLYTRVHFKIKHKRCYTPEDIKTFGV